MVVNDPILYYDRRGQRMLDLAPFGVDCIPLLSQSRFNSRRRGTVYHVHPGCTEICLCLRGRLLFESAGREFNFLPGTVFVSAPDEPHRMRNNPKGLVVMSVLFRHPGRGERIFGLPPRESRTLVAALTHFPQRLFASTERLRRAFARLFEIYDSQSGDREFLRLEMRSAALELLLAVVDACNRRPATFPDKFTAMVGRMERHPEKDYSLKEISREMGLPAFRVNEMFKCVSGLTPHAWLVECRIRAAQKLLADRAASVAAIAGQLGFSSSQHFSAAFARSVGLSPTDWRRRMYKKNN